MDFWHATCLYSMVFAICCTISGAAIEQCGSPQYLELGKAGVINCSFQKESLGLLWYKSTENTTDTLIMKVWDSVKDGRGYDSGEYDIFLNGSLWINNVTSMQDGNFTVVKFRSLEEDEEQFTVVVITTVKPSTRQPLIQGCMSKNTTCFSKSSIASEVVCVVRNARPSISLDWILRTAYGDRNLTSEVTVEHNGITSTTVAITKDAFNFTSVLSLLVCKAHSLPQMFDNDETSVLLENNNTNLLLLTPVQKFIERNSKLELRCSETDINLIVWKKSITLYDNFEPILYAALFDEAVSMTHFDSYELSPDGSLLVPHTDIANEGLYECAYETDVAGNRTLFNVTIYVPAYPVVVGCNKHQYCVLEAEKEGSLTCSVTGIRPLVNLDVGPSNEHDSSSITFTEREVTVINVGEVYDIRMTLKYRIQDTFQERLTLECRISGVNAEILKSTTKFDLLFSSGVESTTQGSLISSGEHNYWIIAVVLVLVLVFIAACGLVIFKVCNKRCIIRRQKKNKHRMIPLREPERETNLLNGDSSEGRREMQNRADPEEVIPLISESDLRVKLKILQDGLKAVYKTFYKAIQPIPYIREKLYCVDDVFVESGIQLVKVSGKKTQSRNTESDTTETENKQMNSYRDIFDDNVLSSKRIIVEGEPGYGKSTLTLQAAYDWCKAKSSSPLASFEVFILLKFRLLRGITSIYKAIKLFALPRDCTLTENDVKEILANCARVVIVLDGFDEYPDMTSDIDSDMMEIIKGKMFAEQKIVVCTRTGCLPSYIDPDTVHVRLTGFDDKARDQYIRLALGGVTNEFANEIKQDLDENPVMSDLCQVPLFFVMFSHMASDSKDILNCDSVTKFFTYMIRCFYNHMWNKNRGVTAHDRFPVETANKSALCKLAFEGLMTDDKQTLVWEKKEFFDKVGKECCEELIQIGILVKEELLNDLTDLSGLDHVPYRHVIRFYHKVFTEWYAAHHLGELAKNFSFFRNWRLGNILKRLDPQDVQFVFRFACGLDPMTFTSIFKYLGGFNEDVASLCIFEAASKVDEIKSIVKKMCSELMQFANYESRLLQRSRIQLLNIASENQISISCVSLFECYSTVYLSGGYHLQLKSNLYIPVLTTLNKLEIWESGREISVEEFTDILQYSSKCLALKELELAWCLLPQSVQAESVSILRSRNVKVIWYILGTWYQLNLQSCLWERFDWNDKRVIGVMTDNDYQREVREFRELWGTG